MKSDLTVRRRARLSKRYVVDVTLSLNGCVVEWEPREPKAPGDITPRELRRYFAVRDRLAQELAHQTNEKVTVMTLVGGGRATLTCFHPSGQRETVEP